MSTDDGGLAFSTMTLRDFFAGQALAGMLANPRDAGGFADSDASNSYIVADAMLAARKAEPR